jgi:ABC-type multidrug transport system fused ATPase/permease subunit
VLAISNALRYPLFNIPTATKAVSGFLAAINNVQEFLLLEEVGGESTVRDLSEVVMKTKGADDSFDSKGGLNVPSITLNNASFSWGSSVLHESRNISFKVSGPHLMAVVGPLAAGKSSLVAGCYIFSKLYVKNTIK